MEAGDSREKRNGIFRLLTVCRIVRDKFASRKGRAANPYMNTMQNINKREITHFVRDSKTCTIATVQYRPTTPAQFQRRWPRSGMFLNIEHRAQQLASP